MIVLVPRLLRAVASFWPSFRDDQWFRHQFRHTERLLRCSPISLGGFSCDHDHDYDHIQSHNDACIQELRAQDLWRCDASVTNGAKEISDNSVVCSDANVKHCIPSTVLRPTTNLTSTNHAASACGSDATARATTAPTTTLSRLKRQQASSPHVSAPARPTTTTLPQSPLAP